MGKKTKSKNQCILNVKNVSIDDQELGKATMQNSRLFNSLCFVMTTIVSISIYCMSKYLNNNEFVNNGESMRQLEAKENDKFSCSNVFSLSLMLDFDNAQRFYSDEEYRNSITKLEGKMIKYLTYKLEDEFGDTLIVMCSDGFTFEDTIGDTIGIVHPETSSKYIKDNNLQKKFFFYDKKLKQFNLVFPGAMMETNIWSDIIDAYTEHWVDMPQLNKCYDTLVDLQTKILQNVENAFLDNNSIVHLSDNMSYIAKNYDGTKLPIPCNKIPIFGETLSTQYLSDKFKQIAPIFIGKKDKKSRCFMYPYGVMFNNNVLSKQKSILNLVFFGQAVDFMVEGLLEGRETLSDKPSKDIMYKSMEENIPSNILGRLCPYAFESSEAAIVVSLQDLIDKNNDENTTFTDLLKKKYKASGVDL